MTTNHTSTIRRHAAGDHTLCKPADCAKAKAEKAGKGTSTS